MSTDATRRARARARRRRFTTAFALVAAVLIVAGVAGAAASLAQGPRLSGVRVDPAVAAAASGSRLILTANQALEPMVEGQVTVEPEVPFTVDASGRSVGVRFTVPLRDDTDYTVRVGGAQGIGGGPQATLSYAFRTPPAEVFLLQRSGTGDDAIFRTDLTGDRSVPVFTHPRIEDFRATRDSLVVSVVEDETSRLVVLGVDGGDAIPLTLPGEGFVRDLQVSDRGDLVGYTYSDRDLDDESGRDSIVYTSSLRGTGDDPVPIEIAGTAPSVAQWRFVPDATAVLLIDFAGDLLLTDPAASGDPTALGAALAIDGITRGTYEAVIERTDGLAVIDLADANERLLVAADDTSLDEPSAVTPVPGGTVRGYTIRDPDGLPIRQSVVFVDDAGEVSPLIEIDEADAVLQACASPSGRYAAVTVAADLVSNPYDGYLQPVPERVQTRVIEIDSGEAVASLTGFALSWCPVGPA